MASYTSSGLVVSTETEIRAEVEATQRGEISDSLDLSTSSPFGQLNRILSRRIRLGEEALGAVYAALDPETATGDALLRLCALTGTYRRAATRTRVSTTCTLVAGTYAIGALVAYPTGRASERYSNIFEIVALADGPISGVLFDAETPGPQQVSAGQLVRVPVAGWSALTNLDGAPGRAIESESALRNRRRIEVAQPGSSSVIGIAADLSALGGVVSAFVIENDTDFFVAGQPPHSIECVVYGPPSPSLTDDAAVAARIYASKASGIATHGTISETVITSDIPTTVRFSRPAQVDLAPSITLVRSASGYAGDLAVAVALSQIVWRPGLDGSWDRMAAAALTVAGVHRITSVDPGSGAFVNVPISVRQIVAIASSGVVVLSSIGVP